MCDTEDLGIEQFRFCCRDLGHVPCTARREHRHAGLPFNAQKKLLPRSTKTAAQALLLAIAVTQGTLSEFCKDLDIEFWVMHDDR